LESAVDKLLKAAELREQDIAKAEELQMQHLTEEEIATRRAELRKMRDLMFRAEIKAKRISKIKSKTYRKIQKKERSRQAEKLKEMGLGVDDETERMKMEINRAKERATLKHKNNGKWAESMRARGELDEDQRKDMQEMYERGERLKKKIAGVDSEDEGSDESEDDDGDARLDELAALAKDDLQPVSLPGRQSGLMEMKFMRDAERRDQASNRDAVDSFNDELSKLGLRQASDEDETTHQRDQMFAISRVGGRVSFNPGETVWLDSKPHKRHLWSSSATKHPRLKIRSLTCDLVKRVQLSLKKTPGSRSRPLQLTNFLEQKTKS
jgi:U3 small nucleolar RNA-associated protein 14